MKMTRPQLIDAIELLLSCCISKLTDHFPDSFDVSERQRMAGGSATDLSEYERGIIQQTIWSIACLTAQTIDDGIGEGDADDMLGRFSEKCAKFVKANWEGYGHPYRARMKEAMNQLGGASYRVFCLNHPDARDMAEKFVDMLEDVEFPHSIVDEAQKA